MGNLYDSMIGPYMSDPDVREQIEQEEALEEIYHHSIDGLSDRVVLLESIIDKLEEDISQLKKRLNLKDQQMLSTL